MTELRFARLIGSDGQLIAQLGRAYNVEQSAARRTKGDSNADADHALVNPVSGATAPAYESYPMEDLNGAPAGVLTLLMDTREHEDTRAALTSRIEFERLITRLSTHFIELGDDMVDADINHALGSIGEFAKIDRAYVFLFSPDGTSMINTHEWCAPGIEPQIDNLQDLPVEVFPWWTRRLKQREVIHVPQVALLGAEAAAERAILQEQAIQSVVVVPLVYAKRVAGFLGFDSVRQEKTWSADDIALLRIVGEMFMNALERRRSQAVRQSLEDQIVAARSLENVAKLAGGVAHDFNNLLGIILNCATAISRGLTDEKLAAYAEDLIAAATQATDLTRQLLIVGRRGVVEPLVFNANHVLRVLENLLQRTLGENVKLRLSLDEAVECVRLGRPQFEQVIVNLAMNARQAMPHGGHFTIATRSVLLDDAATLKYIHVKPGSYVHLSAADTGTGMTPDILAHAFEPFFSTRQPRGTGLGLSTVHGIITDAGGHIELVSSLGEGTTVNIYLPAAGNKAQTTPPTTEGAPTLVGQGQTILVVEDCDSLRNIVCDALQGNGYAVLRAADATQALSLCEQGAPRVDLVLTDVIMPDMSGREMAERMAERFDIRRVVYMSGYEDAVLTQHGVLEPDIRLIQKPFLTDELLRFMQEALK